MRTAALLLGLLAFAGGAGAYGSGGWYGGGNGADLTPLAEGCVCYGYGTGYSAWGDPSGDLHADHDFGSNVGHYATGGGAANLGSGRWVEAWGNPTRGSLEARTNGGADIHGPLFEFAGQDAMLRLDRDRGVHAEAHNNMGGALGQHVGACANAGPGAGDVGSDVFVVAGDVVPFPDGAGLGACHFET